MLRTFRYSLYPTKAQESLLLTFLSLTRELYNVALQQRRDEWKRHRRSLSYFDQTAQLAAIREDRPDFKTVPIVIQRGTLERLKKAYDGFFRRVKSSQGKPGYPRFKGRDRWNTLEINDIGTSDPIVAGGKRVRIPGVGKIKFKQHRLIAGTPKALKITRNGRHWFVCFCCVDVPKPTPLPTTGKEIGIDLGLLSFIATNDGDVIPAPKILRQEENKLARAQRIIENRSKVRPFSNRRRRAVRLLVTQHQRVANIRREFHIKTARQLVKRYDTICVEKLNVKGLARGILRKSVHDAGWSSFTKWLVDKAEEAGRTVIFVNPSGTSQKCSDCGETVKKGLSVRTHRCPHCGLVLDRDVNAARNILAAGRAVRRDAIRPRDTSMTRSVRDLPPVQPVVN